LQQDKVLGQTDIHPYQPRKRSKRSLETFLKAISPEFEVWMMLNSQRASGGNVLVHAGCQDITLHHLACDYRQRHAAAIAVMSRVR
jgi:hypothetical protein